jgi:hypothetical protein
MAVTIGNEPAVSRRFAGRAFGIELRADFGVPGLLEPAHPGLVPRSRGRHLELTVRDAVAANADWPGMTAERTFDLRRPDGSPVFTIDYEPEVGYRVWISGLGQCLIGPEGDRIVCSPPRGRGRWQLLIGQGLPIAAALQGLEVLHASAVRHADMAIAFVAPSGAGKTSTALHLLVRGAAFLADDVVALEAEGDTLMALPGIGLAHAPLTERAALEHAGVRLSWPSRTGAKDHVTVALADAPAPLGAVYFLERTPAVSGAEIIPIDPPDPRLLLGATFVAHVPTARRLITQLDVCSRIARTVPLFRVRMPMDGHAADIAERVAGHVRSSV